MSEIFQAFDAWCGYISYTDCIRMAVRRCEERVLWERDTHEEEE